MTDTMSALSLQSGSGDSGITRSLFIENHFVSTTTAAVTAPNDDDSAGTMSLSTSTSSTSPSPSPISSPATPSLSLALPLSVMLRASSASSPLSPLSPYNRASSLSSSLASPSVPIPFPLSLTSSPPLYFTSHLPAAHARIHTKIYRKSTRARRNKLQRERTLSDPTQLTTTERQRIAEQIIAERKNGRGDVKLTNASLTRPLHHSLQRRPSLPTVSHATMAAVLSDNKWDLLRIQHGVNDETSSTPSAHNISAIAASPTQTHSLSSSLSMSSSTSSGVSPSLLSPSLRTPSPLSSSFASVLSTSPSYASATHSSYKPSSHSTHIHVAAPITTSITPPLPQSSSPHEKHNQDITLYNDQETSTTTTLDQQTLQTQPQQPRRHYRSTDPFTLPDLIHSLTFGTDQSNPTYRDAFLLTLPYFTDTRTVCDALLSELMTDPPSDISDISSNTDKATADLLLSERIGEWRLSKLRLLSIIKCWIRDYHDDISRSGLMAHLIMQLSMFPLVRWPSEHSHGLTAVAERVSRSIESYALSAQYGHPRIQPLSLPSINNNININNNNNNNNNNMTMKGPQLYEYSSMLIAQQFAIISLHRIQSILPRHLLRPIRITLSSNDNNNNNNQMIISNNISLWIASEILLSSSQHERFKIFYKWLKIAIISYSLHNLNGVFEIMYGLLHHSIYRLHYLIKKLNKNEKKNYDKLCTLISTYDNYRMYRYTLSTLSHTTRVPFIGLILKDIIAMEEAPPPMTLLVDSHEQKVPPPSLTASSSTVSTAHQPPSSSPQTVLINFRKCVRIAEHIFDVLSVSDLSYPFPHRPEIYARIRYNQRDTLNETELMERSYQIQPKQQT